CRSRCPQSSRLSARKRPVAERAKPEAARSQEMNLICETHRCENMRSLFLHHSKILCSICKNSSFNRFAAIPGAIPAVIGAIFFFTSAQQFQGARCLCMRAGDQNSSKQAQRSDIRTAKGRTRDGSDAAVIASAGDRR